MMNPPFLDAQLHLDKRKTLNFLVLSMAVITLCFFICACVVSGNANAGFNVILTAIMYVAFVVLVAAIFNKKRAVDRGVDAAMAIQPMVGGLLIGITTMMCFLSLMTAVYWGQMSGCETGTDVTGYSCISSSGMAAVAWFASFLLISEACLLAALVLWKDDLFFVESSGYDNFDAQEDRGAYSSSAYAYDGATFGAGGMGGGGMLGGAGGGGGSLSPNGGGEPQQADL